MRKFNLKATVVQRMRGIEREEPQSPEEDRTGHVDGPDTVSAFSPEQGTLLCAWRTDVGRLRKSNQDAVIVGSGLAGVADGMGGHNGGEIASAGLRDGLLKEIRGREPSAEALEKAVKKVNKDLWLQQEGDITLSGMGTTLTVLWPAADKMLVGQVGDSRAYLLRGGVLEQVTDDHSMVADMVRKGVLTEEQAACHPMRNYITRAVGTEEDVEIDITLRDRKQGDRWLVCSDGLHGMVSRTLMAELLSIADPDEAADRLLQAALENGGKDNVSLVILQDMTAFPEPEPAPETPAEEAPAEDVAESAAEGEVSPQ